MPTIALETISGLITAAPHNNNNGAIQAAVNALDNNNIASAAAIARSKLATTTRKLLMTVLGSDQASFYTGIAFADAITTTVYFQAIFPDDYDSGTFAVKVLRRGAAAGTAKMNYQVLRARDATALATIVASTAVDFIPGDTNTHVTSVTVIVAGNFQAGDVLRLDLTRLGGDAGDTMAASVAFDGMWLEYTGR